MLNDIIEYCVFDVKYMADLFDNYNQKLGNVVALLPETMQRKVNIMAPEDIKHTWEYKILEGSRRRANEVQDPDYERGGWQSMSRCPGAFSSCHMYSKNCRYGLFAQPNTRHRSQHYHSMHLRGHA